MPCPSGKNQYLSQAIAEDALIEARTRHGDERSGPVNVYLCEECGQWHLTSKGGMNQRLADYMRSGKLKLNQEANRWKAKLK